MTVVDFAASSFTCFLSVPFTHDLFSNSADWAFFSKLFFHYNEVMKTVTVQAMRLAIIPS
jgi:hypothetical protein